MQTQDAIGYILRCFRHNMAAIINYKFFGILPIVLGEWRKQNKTAISGFAVICFQRREENDTLSPVSHGPANGSLLNHFIDNLVKLNAFFMVHTIIRYHFLSFAHLYAFADGGDGGQMIIHLSLPSINRLRN